MTTWQSEGFTVADPRYAELINAAMCGSTVNGLEDTRIAVFCRRRGIVSGMALVYHNMGRDRVAWAPGSRLSCPAKSVPLLWGHESQLAIGRAELTPLADIGLLAIARLNMKGMPFMEEVIAPHCERLGFSISFDMATVKSGEYTMIRRAEVVELSLTNVPKSFDYRGPAA